MQRSDIPECLKCTMTREIYLNPVTVFPSGHTYEKDMVDTLMANAKKEGKIAECPLSRKPIESYAPSWAMLHAVDDYLQAFPNARNEQYQHTQASSSSTPSASSSPAPASSSTPLHAAPEAAADRTQQIESDAEIARAWERLYAQEAEAQRSAAASPAASAPASTARERYSQSIYRLQQESALHSAARAPSDAKPREKLRHYFSPLDMINCDKLATDIQDLIYALHFEEGPRRPSGANNIVGLFFAIIESPFLEPLPWQKIKVSDGPKGDAMYAVLKAAKQAINELDPSLFSTAKTEHSHQYDLVKTMLMGNKSLSDGGYASFANAMGTVKNQPGYLVDQMILRVDHMLSHLQSAYKLDEIKQSLVIADDMRMRMA